MADAIAGPTTDKWCSCYAFAVSISFASESRARCQGVNAESNFAVVIAVQKWIV